MSERFIIRGTDKREDFIDAIEVSRPFTTQKASGKDVEYFHESTGFILIKKDHIVSLKLPRTHRVVSVAKLSLGAPLALREFYYAMRNKEDLVRAFEGVKDLYPEVLSAINNMEIFCDLDRRSFTMGNFPKGQMYYGHSYTYGNAEVPIGMTENLARRALDEYEIEHAMSIVHLEKQAAVSRLIEMGFSRLTNTLITTTGGNFTRAVYALANRFHKKKHMMFFCDGDVYGNDMLRALEYGTKASRHLTPFQAFPSSIHPLIHVAGLFPSVAERLGIPNDMEQKRPMQNPHVKKRIEFLQHYGLIDSRDLATWENNQTFELEALSTEYEDSEGNPIGLGIYLVEYMRLNGISCKPQPPEDNEELLEDFDALAKECLWNDIDEEVTEKAPIEKLKDMIAEKFNSVIEKIAREIYQNHIDEFTDEYVRRVTADEIRQKVAEQYQTNPRREKYDLREIVSEMIDDFDITVEWDTKVLEEKIEEGVKAYMDSLPKELSEIYEETIDFFDLPEPEEEIKDFYDVVEEQIGANIEDCEAVREALEWRLS